MCFSIYYMYIHTYMVHNAHLLIVQLAAYWSCRVPLISVPSWHSPSSCRHLWCVKATKYCEWDLHLWADLHLPAVCHSGCEWTCVCLCVLWACVVVCPPSTSRVTPLYVVWPARPNFSSLSMLDLAGQTTLCAVCLGKPQSLVISHLQASGNDSFFEQSLCYATDIYNTNAALPQLRLLCTYVSGPGGPVMMCWLLHHCVKCWITHLMSYSAVPWCICVYSVNECGVCLFVHTYVY